MTLTRVVVLVGVATIAVLLGANLRSQPDEIRCFVDSSYNLLQVPENGSSSFSIVVENTSRKHLRILDFRASCSCTSIPEPADLQPRESKIFDFEISARDKLAGESGAVSVRVLALLQEKRIDQRVAIEYQVVANAIE